MEKIDVQSLVIRGPNLKGGYEIQLNVVVPGARCMRWTRILPDEFRCDGLLKGLKRVYAAALNERE